MNSAPSPEIKAGAPSVAPAAGAAVEDADALPALDLQCRELGKLLGLDGPAPLDVLEAALRDESYAHRLLVSRRNASLLRALLAAPPRARPASAARFSTTALVTQAASALLRWGKTGFSLVDQETLARRSAACQSCPHLTDPPDQLVYRLAAIGNVGRVCGLCGCSAGKKMRLTSESCPDRHPDDAGLTRWGEPYLGSETAAADPAAAGEHARGGQDVPIKKEE